ncbi:hypothetical protein GOV14_06605 [Candidatus Pacearchaeota archaeon]|nr:hypothetical protein [Candidatus Pacearchaeota archaeon]
MDIGLFFEGLILISSIGFVFAVYYAFKLSKETKHEKYWIMLALASLILAVHLWARIPWGLHLITDKIQGFIEQITGILGAILLGYSHWGLYSSMRKVKEKLK